MNKFWGIAVSVILVAAIAAAITLSVLKNRAAEKETTAFVVDTVTAISDDWNAHELINRAEPGLIHAMNSQGQSVYELFRVYHKLGGLTASPDCHLKDSTQFEGTTDSYTTSSYVCEADYDNGHATILLTVRRGKADAEWKVYYINVSSPYFSKIGYEPTK